MNSYRITSIINNHNNYVNYSIYRKLIQNVPLPLLYPKEMHEGIWGGEAIVKGFKKKGKFKRRVPHFWIPYLRKSVIYSEVLNMYMRVVLTDRAMRLIHENYGFDHYLLKVSVYI